MTQLQDRRDNAAHSFEKYKADAAAEPRLEVVPVERPTHAPAPPIKSITALALLSKDFPPLVEILPGVLPEGLAMLCGKPKAGKSWLALDLAIAVATGGLCLGRQCLQGGVLYLALEDGEKRIKSRLGQMLSEDQPPDGLVNLSVVFEWPYLSKGGIKKLEQWLDTYPATRLIIIDTFGRVRLPNAGGPSYQDDTASMVPLHRLTIDRHVTILVIHHTRKMPADDPLDEISGTLGLPGIVDTPLVLRKNMNGTSLCVIGRDIEPVDYAMKFNKDTRRWEIEGTAESVYMSMTANKIQTALENAAEPLSPQEIAFATSLDRNIVQQRLATLGKAGIIRKVQRGKYEYVGALTDTGPQP